MASFIDFDLSKLSLSSPFKPELVRRDNDFTRRFETFTPADRPWSSCSTLNSTYKMTGLDEHSSEYQEVVRCIRRSTVGMSRRRLCLWGLDLDVPISTPQVMEISRIENTYLWQQFCLKRASKKETHPSTKVMELFHGTRDTNVDSICKHNLDWRRMGATGYLGNKYGSGVSFSPCFTYASQFPRGVGSRIRTRTMLLCDVLVYKTHGGSPSVRVPLEGCDATTSPNGKVIVKYDDNEFYPKLPG